MVMRVVKASSAEVRSAWCNSEITLRQAAAAVGMSKDALQARARALGLPPRRTGRREVIRPQHEAEFRVMWAAGIAAREIGQHFGCSYFATVNTATRLGLPMRGAGFRPRITLTVYREVRIGMAMSALAVSEAISTRRRPE